MLGVGVYFIAVTAIATVLVCMLLKWLLENFLTEREASISSFSVAIGNSVGMLLLDTNFEYAAVTDKTGSLLGLVLLWWLLFKRKNPENR